MIDMRFSGSGPIDMPLPRSFSLARDQGVSPVSGMGTGRIEGQGGRGSSSSTNLITVPIVRHPSGAGHPSGVTPGVERLPPRR